MKVLSLILSVFMLAGCVAKPPEVIEEVVRAVMVDNKIYYDTGLAPEELPFCGTMDGEITSNVAEAYLPKENNQSNFDACYGYQNYSKNEIIVLIDTEGWQVFRCEDEWGITLAVENVTTKGLTLVCTQKAGNIKGELQTGTFFTLEEKTDGVWKEVKVKMLGDWAWEMVAYSIMKNDITKLGVNWEFLYGELPEGEYRIGKEIMDYIAPGEYEKATYYVEFEIKGL